MTKTPEILDIGEKIHSVLEGGDILLIIPPFAMINIALVGPLSLQAVATEGGYKTEVLHLNILLASVLGKQTYDSICNMPYNTRWMKMGERLFAASAYGLPPLGTFPESSADEATCISGPGHDHAKVTYESTDFDLGSYLEIERLCTAFIYECVRALSSFRYRIIGCTTMVEQTNCSVALINGLKKTRPEVVTLMGGLNCDGIMAQGIASLSESIDYVFSGESELALRDFLRNHQEGKLPSERVITADPPRDLDTLPLPDYRSFFDQMDRFMGHEGPKQKIVCYESSRGCWWGQKQRCSFCGNNTHKTIVYRRKSEEKVVRELAVISRSYKAFGVLMADNIVPRSYYTKLFPKLAEIEDMLPLWYQENANLELDDLLLLKRARVHSVLFGIESLSSGLLKLINKQTDSHRNLLLLRNARSVGLYGRWHFLWGFPGDKREYYEEILRLLPFIRHLQPPDEILHLVLVRFSAYVNDPAAYRIANLRPAAIYRQIYPEWAHIDRLAYEFIGDYPCAAHENPEIIQEIVDKIVEWRSCWQRAILAMRPFGDEYVIYDGRHADGKMKTHSLDYAAAREVMTSGLYEGSEFRQWALQERLGVVADSLYTPLITASPDLLLKFENSSQD